MFILLCGWYALYALNRSGCSIGSFEAFRRRLTFCSLVSIIGRGIECPPTIVGFPAPIGSSVDLTVKAQLLAHKRVASLHPCDELTLCSYETLFITSSYYLLWWACGYSSFLGFTWRAFSPAFDFNLFVSLYLKCLCCKQHRVGSCFVCIEKLSFIWVHLHLVY